MLSNLRNIAILMLAAGISLGVFANTLFASRNQPIRSNLERSIEERVKLYREAYNLDDGQAEAVRQVIVAHKRDVLNLLLRLRRENRNAFSDLQDKAEKRIREIIEKEK